MTGTPNRAQEPVEKLDKRYRSGDTTIVSSDGVTFHVDSAFLIATSQGFRDLLSLGTLSDNPCTSQFDGNSRNPIQLVDAEIEDGDTIRRFLGLIHGHWNSETNVPINTVAKLLQLCHKYDCSPLLRNTLIVHLTTYKRNSDREFAFILAAMQDNQGVAELLLGHLATVGLSRKFKDDVGVAARGCKALSPCLKPCYMAPEYVRLLPPRYVWALGRAYDEIPTVSKKHKSEDIVRKFIEAMQLWDDNMVRFPSLPAKMDW